MAQLEEIARIATALVLLLLSAHAMGSVFARLRQPRVIGEILGGLLLGRTVLATLLPDAAAWAFPETAASETVLWLTSQVGLSLLMYSSGAQLRGLVSRGERRVVKTLSLAGIVPPFVVGMVAVQCIDQSSLQGSARNDLAFLLVFATAIAIASIPVIARIMLDLGILDTPFARIVVATALIDDLALYVALAVALSLVHGHPQGIHDLPSQLGLPELAPLYHVLITLAVVATVALVGPLLIRRGLRLKIGRARWNAGTLVSLVILLAVSGLCLSIGVNPMFGALAVGMAAGRVSQQESQSSPRTLSRIGVGFFIPLYFALVGLRLDLLHHFDAVFFVGFLTFACAVKAASIYVGARACGESQSAAMNFAAALNARGGPGIVLATVSFDAGIINENFFAILVLVAIVTSMIAGSWLGSVVRRGGELRGNGVTTR